MVLCIIGQHQEFEQWGDGRCDDYVTTLPISFTSAFLAGFASPSADVVWGSPPVVSRTQNTLSSIKIGANGATSNDRVKWLAIGYQQWGYSGILTSDGTKNVSFPIAFSNCFNIATCIADYEQASYVATVVNYNNSGFNYFCYTGRSVFWIALGMQQWGYVSGEGDSKTWTFPIVFTTACYGASIQAVTNHGSSAYASQTKVRTYSTTNLIYYVNSGGGAFLLAYGMQQWGKSAAASGDTVISFPISFSSTIYTFVTNYNYKDYENSYAHTISNSKFTLWAKYADGVKTWIFIGKQQWGEYYCPQGSSYRTITYTFPISFPNSCFGVFPVDNLGDIDRSYVNTFAVTSISKNVFNIWIAKGEPSTYRMIAIGY